MEIVGAAKPSIKIGWAFDWKNRERQFNQASMPEIGGLRYKTIFYEFHGSAMEAFQMEQSLLKEFDSLRHRENVEILTPLTKDQVQRSWINYLAGKNRP